MAKVKASTLLETIIAMALLLTVFFISGAIFNNISISTLNFKIIKANEIANNYFQEVGITENNMSVDVSEVINGFFVECKTEPYQNSADLIHAHIRVFDNKSKLIVEHNRIVINNNK